MEIESRADDTFQIEIRCIQMKNQVFQKDDPFHVSLFLAGHRIHFI